MKSQQQYELIKALRPFSLVVAVVSCGLGIFIAWNQGYQNNLIAGLVMLGGILAQAGINLINDIEDLSLLDSDQTAIRNMILNNTKIGIICFVIASLIAAYLISIQGIALFILILISALASLSYNIGPLNFKNRGLAMIQVFLIMGIMMVQGAYLSMTGQFSFVVLLHSIPIGLLISLLLLSNELRDWEADQQDNIRTLTVRIGYKNAVKLYWFLVFISYVLAGVYYLYGELQNPLWLLFVLPLLLPIKQQLVAKKRIALTPMTGRFFFLFGMAYLLSI